MFSETQKKVFRYATRGIIIFIFLLAGYGYWLETEDDLQDTQRVALFEQAFKMKAIAISQRSTGGPLIPDVPKYAELPKEIQEGLGKEIDNDEWERMRKQTYRFVAAVNQGLGDPFEYEETDGDRARVTKVKEDSLRYHNPFQEVQPGPITTPISSSEVVAHNREGWRIVSRDLVLYLKPGATPKTISAGAQNVSEIGGEFTLASGNSPNITLRISTEGDGVRQVLRLDPRGVDRKGRTENLTRRHGDYFVWDGRPFGVYRANTPLGGVDSTAVGDLVFSKEINGKPLRIQVLGRATANLIGSPVGGETRHIDGAFLHSKARRLVLTIDPEIQSAAYYFLASSLKRLDDKHACKLTRPRRGAVSVLDAETGQILAHAGAPGYDPLWEGTRVVLANRQRITDNAANDVHMPGSAVKVMTAAMGYLLFGEGSGEMLPASINQLAIRQAFRNVYGGSLPPPGIVDDTRQADVTPAGRQYFDDHAARPARPRDDFAQVLDAAFYVLDHKPDEATFKSKEESIRGRLYEQIVFGDIAAYFNPDARYDFFPLRSRFPVRDIDDVNSKEQIQRMDLFRMYAIGSNETRFTTLRLGATLITATTGQLIRPYIVESVFDPAVATNGGRVTNRGADIFPNLSMALHDVEGANNGNSRHMAERMMHFLTEVCAPPKPHTGYYINAAGDDVFMTENDQTTPNVNEAQFREGDYGKTGTADYGKIDPDFDDSLFVYRHGRYVIAVWMERADGPGTAHPAHGVLNQIVSFIDDLEPPRRGH